MRTSWYFACVLGGFLLAPLGGCGDGGTYEGNEDSPASAEALKTSASPRPQPCNCWVRYGDASKSIYATSSSSYAPSSAGCMANVCLPLLTGSPTGTVSNNGALDSAVRAIPNSAELVGALPATGWPSKAQYLRVTARLGNTGTFSYANIRGPLPARQCPPGTWRDTATGRCDEALGTTGHPECFNAVTGTVLAGVTSGVDAGGGLITANGNQIHRYRSLNCALGTSVPACHPDEYVSQLCNELGQSGRCELNLTNCDMAGHTLSWISLGNDFYTSDNRQIYHHHSWSYWGW